MRLAPWPIREFPKIRSADWGYKVSVCIAALCHQRKKIVAVSDMKVSFSGDYSADDVVVKSEPLTGEWHALFAGDDIAHVPFVTDRARELLRKNRKITPQAVARAVDRALTERLHKQIEAEVLRKFGFTTNTFNLHGKKRMTETTYNNLCSKIDKIKLSMKFLVAGFDASGSGHLIEVGVADDPMTCDSPGFWAIGSGATTALGTLAFHADKGHLSIYKDVGDCIYCLCDAKFMAESASDVGRSTFLTIFENGKDVRFISTLRTEEIRNAWERYGSPRVPKAILASIPNMIYSMKELREGGMAGLERIMGRIKPPKERHFLKEYKAIRRAAEATK